MAGAIGISMILAFALPYFYLQGMERNNSKAFDTEYISLLEQERASNDLHRQHYREVASAHAADYEGYGQGSGHINKTQIEEITPKPKRR